jgi:hypothetical protein
MPDIKISQLPAASTPLLGTEELPLVQGGVTSKATAQDIADLGGGGGLAIPTVTITPALPSWTALTYVNPRSLTIDAVTTQINTYSPEDESGAMFGYYYGFQGSNLITAFSTDAEAIGGNLLSGVYNSNSADPSLTSISLPTVKAIVGQGFQTYGQLTIYNSNLTSVSLPSLVVLSGINFYGASGLTSISLPLLTNIQNTGGDAIYISGGSNFSVPSFSLPSLTTVGNGSISLSSSTAGPTTISFPNLAFVNGNTINVTFPSTLVTLNFNSLEILPNITSFTINAPGLTSFGLPALKQVNTGGYLTFDFNGCILDQTSVDNILVTLAALDGTLGTTNWSVGAVNIAGGCAAPSGTGAAAVATLIGRGISVSTN